MTEIHRDLLREARKFLPFGRTVRARSTRDWFMYGSPLGRPKGDTVRWTRLKIEKRRPCS